MKKLILILITVYSSITAFAQCTPDPSVTQPGLFPPDSLLPCIVQNQPYDTVIQFKNFTTVNPSDFGITTPFPITITVNWIRIDSILNLPTGLDYECNEPTCYYTSGQNGCIRLTGTTTDPRGNYELGLIFTVSVSVPLFLDTVIQINSADAEGFGAGGFADIFSYMLQVIEPGDPCPYPVVSVAAADSILCEGSTTVLQPAIRFGVAPFTYTWSPSTGLSDTTIENPTATLTDDITYSLTVVDNNGTEFSTDYELLVTKLPVADFTFNVIGNTVTFESTSQNALGIRWDFGDGGTANGPNAQRVFSATSETTFDVTMTAQSDCGDDVVTKSVTVTSIAEKNKNDFSFTIMPNPNNGFFNVKINSEELIGKDLKISLFNVNGTEVYSENVLITTADLTASVKINALSKGIYFLHLATESQKAVTKVSIIH